jgi:hypothetical protein
MLIFLYSNYMNNSNKFNIGNLYYIILLLILLILYISSKIIYTDDNNINLLYYEKQIYSQHGEDGVTEKIIDLIYGNDKSSKYYVEFGVENGMECNTRILREKYNWTGLLMDGSNNNKNINLNQEFITKENIISLFKKYNVPSHINLLCIDLDFNDFYILHEVLKLYTSDIIILEYNSTFKSNEDKVVIYDKDTMWDGTNYFGASLYSYTKLCEKYNYTLVYVDSSGVNAYYIKNDIIINNKINILNMGDINKIYRSPIYSNNDKVIYKIFGRNIGNFIEDKFMNRPYGGHIRDPYNRQLILFEDAIKY